MFKLEFNITADNTIRVWMHYDKNEIASIWETKEFKLFELLSIWSGFDKCENGLYSWEFPLSLGAWIKEKFMLYPNCEIQLQ